jgi:DNA-binding transcriptional MerR regulator
MHIECLEDGFFNSRELRILLAKHRQKAVPDRTLRFWRNQLKIFPQDGYLYTQEDLQLLVRLVRWIARGGTIDGFKAILRAEYDRTIEENTIA